MSRTWPLAAVVAGLAKVGYRIVRRCSRAGDGKCRHQATTSTSSYDFGIARALEITEDGEVSVTEYSIPSA